MFQFEKPPFHFYSIIAIVALDLTWGFVEGVSFFASPAFVLVLSLLSGMIGCAVVFYVQRRIAHDSQEHALAKGMVMGIVAGVPFMVTGTVLGLAVMVWLAAASVMKETPTDAEEKRKNVSAEDEPLEVR